MREGIATCDEIAPFDQDRNGCGQGFGHVVRGHAIGRAELDLDESVDGIQRGYLPDAERHRIAESLGDGTASSG